MNNEQAYEQACNALFANTVINTPKEKSQQTQSLFDNSHLPIQKQQGSNDKFSKLHSLMKPFDTSMPVRKTEFIGGIYPKGYVSIIMAPSGTGKSLFLQKDIYDTSIGGHIFGGIAESEPERKSIILCGELGEQGLREREQEFQFKKKSENIIVIDQTKCESEGISFMLNTKEGQENIEYLASTKPDILAVDSFTAFFGGKENDNSECNAVFGFLRRIAARYNIAVVITHHSRKRLSTEQGKPLTLDDAIGAGAITRHVYTVIAIEYQKVTGLNIVTCLKSWGKKFKPFGYKINNSCALRSEFYHECAGQTDCLDGEKFHRCSIRFRRHDTKRF